MLVASIAFLLVAGVILRRSRARRIHEQIVAGTFGGLSEEFALLRALPVGVESRRRASGQSVRVWPGKRQGAARACGGARLGGPVQGRELRIEPEKTGFDEKRSAPQFVDAEPHRPAV